VNILIYIKYIFNVQLLYRFASYWGVLFDSTTLAKFSLTHHMLHQLILAQLDEEVLVHSMTKIPL
jgi:hypothetical protein